MEKLEGGNQEERLRFSFVSTTEQTSSQVQQSINKIVKSYVSIWLVSEGRMRSYMDYRRTNNQKYVEESGIAIAPITGLEDEANLPTGTIYEFSVPANSNPQNIQIFVETASAMWELNRREKELLDRMQSLE